MMISVTDAKGQLTELVRRAEAGEDVVLTRHGREAVRLVPMSIPKLSTEGRRKLLEKLKDQGSSKAEFGPGAARSQDDLYDDAGMPM